MPLEPPRTLPGTAGEAGKLTGIGKGDRGGRTGSLDRPKNAAGYGCAPLRNELIG
jgi:hypothetical protein